MITQEINGTPYTFYSQIEMESIFRDSLVRMGIKRHPDLKRLISDVLATRTQATDITLVGANPWLPTP